jgi:hypothetical protein
MSRPKTYTPPLKPFLVKALYHEARLQGQPMTTLANQIMEAALVNTTGWQRATEALNESPAPYRSK